MEELEMYDNLDIFDDEDNPEYYVEKEEEVCYKDQNLLINKDVENETSVSDKYNSKNIHSLEINTNKAGMEGLDKQKINEIVQKASQGSKFYEHKQRCQERIDAKILQMKSMIETFKIDQIKKAEIEMNKLAMEMERERDLTKTITHIDMDMFYAAVEMRDNPSLKNKPMAVGGNSMLSTSNYAARKFGVRAAMPGFIGKKLCPELIIVPCNFKKYRDVSSQIQNIFENYDPQFCPMSLDEAYLDITNYLNANAETYNACSASDLSAAELVVQEIRNKIEEKTTLTASAGIAPNTRLAKICSDMNKPNGQYYLKPDKEVIQQFIDNLPIRKVSGIGNVTEQQLRALGVVTCSDLWTYRGLIRLLFSESSYRYFLSIALGLGSTEVSPGTERDRKSISNETTFSGTSDRQSLAKICEDLCKELKEDMSRKNLVGKVFTLKMKTTNFQVRTRAQSLFEYTQDEEVLCSVAQKLLFAELDSESSSSKPLSLRLLGARMSNLLDQSQIKKNHKQLTLTNLFKKSNVNTNGNLREVCSNNEKGSNGVIERDKVDAVQDIYIKSNHLCDRTQSLVSNSSDSNSEKPSTSENICDNSSSIGIGISNKKENFSCENSLYSKNDSHKTDKIDGVSEKNTKYSEYINSPLYVCPVCNKGSFESNEDLNVHLDTCLNQEVVHKLVNETNKTLNSTYEVPHSSNAGRDLKSKRKGNNFTINNKKSKKTKNLKCVNNTLHKYLVTD